MSQLMLVFIYLSIYLYIVLVCDDKKTALNANVLQETLTIDKLSTLLLTGWCKKYWVRN